jgi:peptidoglycan/LPS O-acetylase OafA/YrhL
MRLAEGAGMRADQSGILPTAASRYHALDAVRVLACASVIVAHSPLWPGRFGGHGVSMFMVLSGFVITLLLEREWARRDTLDLGEFWSRRLLRLVPAYLAYVAFVLLIDFVRGRPWSLGLLASTATFTVNYYNALSGHAPTPVAHTWSLSVEQQFYLVWPIVFLALRRDGAARVRRVLAGVIGVVIAWRCAFYFGLGGSMAWVWNAFETRADALALGCLLALGWDTAPVRRAASVLGRWAPGPLATLALLVLSRSALSAEWWQASLGLTFTAVLAGVLVVQLAALETRAGGTAWGHPAVRYLGRITYGTYLFHALALDAAMHLPIGAAAQTLVAMVLAFATGAVVNVVVEQRAAALVAWWRARGDQRPAMASGDIAQGRRTYGAPALAYDASAVPRVSGAHRIVGFVARYLRRAA